MLHQQLPNSTIIVCSCIFWSFLYPIKEFTKYEIEINATTYKDDFRSSASQYRYDGKSRLARDFERSR